MRIGWEKHDQSLEHCFLSATTPCGVCGFDLGAPRLTRKSTRRGESTEEAQMLPIAVRTRVAAKEQLHRDLTIIEDREAGMNHLVRLCVVQRRP